MSDVLRERAHGWLRFNSGAESWSVPDPEYEEYADALHAARNSLASLTQTQAYMICQLAETYVHLTTHPAGSGYAQEQLRAIRAALRAARALPAKEGR